MNPSPTPQIIKYIGLDVHAQTVAVAIAQQGGDVLSYGTIPAHSHSMDRLHKKLSEGGAQVRYVYEAGPTGFWLARHLRGKQSRSPLRSCCWPCRIRPGASSD